MLMALGLFVFHLGTAPFETLRRSTQQRWESKPRVGQAPAWQWVGPGEDSLTIEGTLAPELTGGPDTLDTLREMADSGRAWILVAGTGEVMGKWFIASVDETRSHMRGDGSPRKIAFTLSLKRYWGEDTAVLGELMDSLPQGNGLALS